jgi:uncharacterized protein
MAAVGASLYDCRVTHRRHAAPQLRFSYRLFYLLVDIDQLDALPLALRLFSHNRANLVSLHDRDHGSGAPAALRSWAEGLLRGAGIDLQGGRIRLLCLPRVFGFAFNPLSLWYCEDRAGVLRAVIAQVRNTFGERHSYLLDGAGRPLDWQHPVDKDKVFHVSPFLDVAGRYRFRLEAPGAALRLTIHETRDEAPLLDASLTGRARALSDPSLLASVARMPWVTVKVVLAIHWQALRLWLAGAAIRRKPAAPSLEVT